MPAFACTPQELVLDGSAGLGSNDYGLHGVAKRCTALTALSLADTNVNDAALMASLDVPRRVKSRPLMSGLRHLNVEGCKRVTDSSIVAITAVCPALEVVNVSGCHFVTDAAVGKLASRCPQLASLGAAR